jgi:dTDP-4-amino-4,6-dideoxygalactose transaminase
MTTGEGGMITTNDDQLAEQIRLFRSHGMTSLTWDREKGHSFSYDVIAPGYNYRIDEIRSALGIVQLKKIDRNNQRRMEIVKIYRDRLSEVEGISLPFLQEQGISAYHICPILLDKDIDRNRFISGMIDAGVQVSIHYPPIHTFSEYRRENAHDGESDLPITENIAKRIVTLPLFSNMRQDQIEYVIDSLLEWIMRMKETSKNERCRSS